MKFKSALVTQASGSVGGFTAAHNSAGLYLRARSIPVNPDSSQQQTIRNAMSRLASRWNGSLTDIQREGWNTYGASTPITNTLGDQINVSGIAWYQRLNVPALQTGLDIVDDAPEVFAVAGLTTPEVDSFDTGAGTVDLTINPADQWANETGGALLVYSSRPFNPGVTFFQGPFRFAAIINGDDTTPPTSPQTVGLPFAVSAGQQVAFSVRSRLADGRVSSAIRFRSGAIS